MPRSGRSKLSLKGEAVSAVDCCFCNNCCPSSGKLWQGAHIRRKSKLQAARRCISRNSLVLSSRTPSGCRRKNNRWAKENKEKTEPSTSTPRREISGVRKMNAWKANHCNQDDDAVNFFHPCSWASSTTLSQTLYFLASQRRPKGLANTRKALHMCPDCTLDRYDTFSPNFQAARVSQVHRPYIYLMNDDVLFCRTTGHYSARWLTKSCLL